MRACVCQSVGCGCVSMAVSVCVGWCVRRTKHAFALRSKESSPQKQATEARWRLCGGCCKARTDPPCHTARVAHCRRARGGRPADGPLCMCGVQGCVFYAMCLSGVDWCLRACQATLGVGTWVCATMGSKYNVCACTGTLGTVLVSISCFSCSTVHCNGCTLICTGLRWKGAPPCHGRSGTDKHSSALNSRCIRQRACRACSVVPCAE